MTYFRLILLVLMGIFAVIYYPNLPEMMPMHWNLIGQADSYMPKNQAIIIMPLVAVLMMIMYLVLPLIDPKKDKYSLFKREWEIIQTGFICFIAYMQFIVLYLSLNPQARMLPLMFIGLGSLYVLIGNYLSKIRQNYFVGIKVPWTLANEDNWNKTHRYASWCFVIAGVATLAESYFLWHAPVVIFGGIFMAGLLPVIYSFLLFKKSAHLMKLVYALLILVVISVTALRLVSPEDDWLCVKGQWVKHGAPSALQPSVPCE